MQRGHFIEWLVYGDLQPVLWTIDQEEELSYKSSVA
jgi:hypothetical protein